MDGGFEIAEFGSEAMVFKQRVKLVMSLRGRNILFSKPLSSLCRFSGYALVSLSLAGFLCAGARAQTTPTVASFAAGVNQADPSAKGGAIPNLVNVANIAIDSFGDVLAVDDGAYALYEFPAGGGNAEILVAAGGLAGSAKSATVPGIAIDSSNNLYIEGGSCVLMYPYDGSTGTWDALASLNSSNTSASVCGSSAPTFVNFGAGAQVWGIAINSTSTPSLLVGTSSSSGISIMSVPVTGAWTAPVAGTPATVITGMQAAAISVAADPSGNTYFVEQNAAGALSGAYEIPAGQTGLTSDSGLTRIDPDLPAVTGVASDSTGNIYLSDNKEGVYLLPVGFTSSSSALLLTSLPAQGTVASYQNAFMDVPTTKTLWNQVSGLAKVGFNTAEFGSATVGATTPQQGPVTFSFNAGTTTPGTIEVLEAGSSNPDFAVVSGGTTACQAPPQTPYTAGESCTVTLSFTPHAAGNVSATLAMLDSKGNLLASIPLNGSGISAAVQVLPQGQATLGGGLKTPSQIAVDAAGNVYVADSGLGTVEMYPAGSGAGATATPVGQNLTAPTGVAVDGGGDVFIADSGFVYEVPNTASGLNSKGQVTLKSGLGSHVWLAADGLGDLYVSDADNKQVYELENFSAGWNPSGPGVLGSDLASFGTTFSAPAQIAVDPYNDLFVVDGGSVDELVLSETVANQSYIGNDRMVNQVLTGLSGVTGLAIDPSGSVYVSASGGTMRIPNVAGTLKTSDESAVASSVTNPDSVAIDLLGNLYLADGTALDVNVTTASSEALNFGTLTADPYPAPSLGSSSTQTVTLLNYGNAPLLVTGYTSTPDFFEPDYTETADTCSGNSIAVDSTCTATITFSPGIGDGGSLTGEVLVDGNVANSPVGANGTGVAPTLAGTTTTNVVSANGNIDAVPVSISVAPSSGTGPTPTGTVTLTITPGSNVPPTLPALPSPYELLTSLTNGAAQLAPTGLTNGNYTFTARYNGDPTYIYEHSSTPVSVAVTKSVPITLTQPAPSAIALETYTLPCTAGTPSSCTTTYSYGQPSGNPAAYLVLSTGVGSAEPYDGTATQWEYTLPVSVADSSGAILVGLPVYNPAKPTQQIAWNYGSVNFESSNGQSVCGQSPGSDSIVNVDGTGAAAFAVGCVPVNTSNTTIPDILTYYSFTPVYTGTYNDLVTPNPNYAQATGQPVAIYALTHPMVQLSASPAALTVAAGSTVSTTITLSSVLGYGYAGRNDTQLNYGVPLDLQCQGLPPYATCSFTYPTPSASDPNFTSNPTGLECATSTPAYCSIDVGPDAGSVMGQTPGSGSTSPCAAIDGCLGPGSVTMTITTNVPVGTTTSSLAKGRGGITFAAMFGLGLLGIVLRRKAARWRGLLMVLCLLLLGGAFMGFTACSTKTLGTTSTATVTPSGSYWVTVTAKEAGSILVACNSGPLCMNGEELVPGNGNQMSLPYTVYVTVGQ
jgi:sugar lactone lactonase YvrE